MNFNLGCLKCCCCLSYCCSNKKASNKNIDKLEELIQKVLSTTTIDKSISYFDYLDRPISFDLCNWSNEVLFYLEFSKFTSDDLNQTNALIDNFNSIKEFYKLVKTAKLENHQRISKLYDSIQLYEVTMSLAFVIFQEKPNIIMNISEQIKKAQNLIESISKRNFLLNARIFDSYLFHELDEILSSIDNSIGQFNLVRIEEFVLNIIEVLCKYIQVDLKQMDKFILVDLINNFAVFFNKELKKTAFYKPNFDLIRRENKWSILKFTELVYINIELFDESRNVIERLIISFKRLFNSLEDFEKQFKSTLEQINLLKKLPKLIRFEDNKVMTIPQKNEFILDSIRKTSYFNEFDNINLQGSGIYQMIESIGKTLQKIEAFLIYTIIFTKNQEDILYPLSGHLDECSRILEKFCNLHILFKLTNGDSFLNKLNVIVKRIIELFESSNSKLKLKDFDSIEAKEYMEYFSELIYTIGITTLQINDKIEFENVVLNLTNEFIDKKL